jgi:hypothetical protein
MPNKIRPGRHEGVPYDNGLWVLFSDTPQRLGKIRVRDASETDTINRTMYQICGTTSTVT